MTGSQILLDTFRPVIGIAALLALAWAFSENQRGVRLRPVFGGMALQLALAMLLLRLSAGAARDALATTPPTRCNTPPRPAPASCSAISAARPSRSPRPSPAASFILAFQALPLVLTISALASLLFYWGMLQRVTRGFAWLLRRTMGMGGALALGAAVHVFVGMVEAPLLVRPYLARMQRGELFALMTCGMAGRRGHGDGDLRLLPRRRWFPMRWATS